MSAQLTSRRATNYRKTKALLYVFFVISSGCFGAPAMQYDIQDYNRAIVTSEKKMLLFNIGALHYGQPPHFMMLSTVSQSRTFSSSAGFTWTNPASWVVPFVSSATENPLVQFVPIQGQDFAQRFESPMTDKLELFLEDRRLSADFLEDQRLSADIDPQPDEELIMLLADAVVIIHGDSNCPGFQTLVNGMAHFKTCVDEIVTQAKDFEVIDGHRLIPTEASEDPKAADLVTALSAGYEWTKADGKFALANMVRVPAWFDYIPTVVTPTDSSEPDSSPPPVFWVWNRKPGTAGTSDSMPDWKNLQYTLPEDYEWKKYPEDTMTDPHTYVYALLPKGYDLERDPTGKLKTDANGEYVAVKTPVKAAAHSATGHRTGGSTLITNTKNTFVRDDIGKRIFGVGIPQTPHHATIVVAVDPAAETAKMSSEATVASSTTMHIGDEDDLSYVDEIVNKVWPVPQDYFYFELRNDQADDAEARVACFSQSRNLLDNSNPVVCGFFKIGRLLTIMSRLATSACDESSIVDKCIFGIGYSVPSWADSSAPYQLSARPDAWAYRNLAGPYVWVPAHNPETEPNLAHRDRRAFLILYELYQMSLVDTSKLVTGFPPITISK
jgi:hypothetical protein